MLIERIQKLYIMFCKRKYALPIAVFLIGVVFVAGSSLFSSDQKVETDNDKTVNEYVKKIEKSLEGHICKMGSVSDCSVMITLRSTKQNTYLENSSQSVSNSDNASESSNTSEYLLIDSSDGKNVVVESTLLPEVNGVFVVYDGPANIIIKKNITDAVATVLGIQSNKVFVVSNQE